jgi:hypothetical protein
MQRMIIGQQAAIQCGLLNPEATHILYTDDDFYYCKTVHARMLDWWPMIHDEGHWVGSIYDAGVCDRGEAHTYGVGPRSFACMQVQPEECYALAGLMPRRTAELIVRDWWGWKAASPTEGPDIRMSRIAGRYGPIYYHTPSLVQHFGKTTWGGPVNRARTFQED